MRALTLLAATLALAGCASELDAPLSPTMGAAVASMDNQIIDPTPAQGAPESSAARGVAAIDRYDKGQVKQPPSNYGQSGGESSDQGDSGPGDAKK